MLFFASPLDLSICERYTRAQAEAMTADDELKVVLVDRQFGHAFSETLDALLAEAGKDGYELVHIDLQKTPEKLTYRCILKRALSPSI